MPCVCVSVWDAQQCVWRCGLCGAIEFGDPRTDEMLRNAELALAVYCASDKDETPVASPPREGKCAAAAPIKRRARRNETAELMANSRAFLAYDSRVAARRGVAKK